MAKQKVNTETQLSTGTTTTGEANKIPVLDGSSQLPAATQLKSMLLAMLFGG